MTAIPKTEWVWFGYPGHFIAASACMFRLHTRVGNYRISTVGDYRPDRERPAQTIGAGEDSYFETFVFAVIGHGKQGEGEVADWGEIDGERYATAEDAESGHMRYCAKYADPSMEVTP